MKSKWVEWKGGECPVEEDAYQVFIRTRLGVESEIAVYPEKLRWIHANQSDDIVAYKSLTIDEYKHDRLIDLKNKCNSGLDMRIGHVADNTAVLYGIFNKETLIELIKIMEL